LIRNVLRIVLAVLAVHVVVPDAYAQSGFSAAYQYVRMSIADETVKLPAGFAVDYARPLMDDGWKVVGAFGWGRRSDDGVLDAYVVNSTFTQLTLAGGVRREIRTRTKATPYFQAVAGIVRSRFSATFSGEPAYDESASDPMFEPGAGVAWAIGRRFAVFGQVDYRRLWPDAGGLLTSYEAVQGFRTSAGARVRMP